MSSGVVATRRASTRATGLVRARRPRRGARAVVGADSAESRDSPPPRIPTNPRSTTRCPIAATNAGSCVMDTRVTPRSRAERSRRTRPSHVPRSWPKVGSSRISSSGALMRAVATDRRRFSPPDSVIGLARASLVRPRASRCSSTRGAISSSVMPTARGPMASSSATVEARNWYSGSWKTMDMRPSSRLLGQPWGSPAVPSAVSTSTVPSRGGRRPASVSANVDFPAPFAPTMQVDTPRSIVRSMPDRTGEALS